MPMRTLAGWCLATILCVAGCGTGAKPEQINGPGAPAGPAPGSPEAAAQKEAPMLTVQKEPFGTTPEGDEITQYTLQNGTGMQVSLIDFGATVVSVDVPDRDGKLTNVNLRHPDLEAYLINAPYFGGICGRYANRIANGKFSLDGTEYTLAANNSGHHLHGGLVGFNRKVWKSEPEQTADSASVRVTYTSPDGEEGYPGALKVVVVYSLNTQNELSIDYTATTDQPTVLNLTNHCYWNLAGEGTILDHDLTLMCDKYLPVDEGAIPTGELAPVSGTVMDFTTPHKIGERIGETVNGGGGYDHCYIINGSAGTLRPAAKIVEPKSGRVLEISTTEPAIQLYTGNFLDGTPATGNAPKNGAFCLEAQHYPDSPNHPEFPTTRLNPGETYRQTTVHKFSVQK